MTSPSRSVSSSTSVVDRNPWKGIHGRWVYGPPHKLDAALLTGRVNYTMSYPVASDADDGSPFDRLSILMDAALELAGEHDLEAVLKRTVERAILVADATYAAIGVYENGEISAFLHEGIDEATVFAIGEQPHGRGLLGETIASDGPTRVDDISTDSRSVGFPLNHPSMRTFLGVPVRSAGRRYGSLYVTDKRGKGGVFDETDERLVSALATFAGCAIDNSMLLQVERDRAETTSELAALQAAAVLRREVLAQVIEAQEAERTRVARDLHDEIGQSLTSMLLALRIVENTSPGSAEFFQRAEELRELITDALDDVRRLAFDLRPTVLDDIGLVAAIGRLVETLRTRVGLTVTAHFGDLDDNERLPRETETVIFRIVQEALTNVARHAGVASAAVEFSSNDDTLVVEVRDEGRGFDPTLTSGSLGLAGMDERASLIDGRLTVFSAPTFGTTIRLETKRG